MKMKFMMKLSEERIPKMFLIIYVGNFTHSVYTP